MSKPDAPKRGRGRPKKDTPDYIKTSVTVRPEQRDFLAASGNASHHIRKALDSYPPYLNWEKQDAKEKDRK